jgi:iron complex outermembrane receptor protein
MFKKSEISRAITAIIALNAAVALAQDGVGPPLEEVLVTGSQIKGADMAGALPVSVLNEEDIALTGAATGDELLRSIPQMGAVGFNEATTTGVNAARGDVSSINLRGLGTGNTLVLIDGRRMVLHPGTQTENRIPVVTSNANTIPVASISRLEVLRDGAAALYGSDAVAGVVNYILRNDYTDGEFNIRYGESQGTDLDEVTLNAGKGFDFNGGSTNLVVSGSYYTKNGMEATERDYAENSDLRGHFVGDPLFEGDTSLDNRSSNHKGWGVFDYDGVGRQHVRPVDFGEDSGNTVGAADCSYGLGNGVCLESGSDDRALRTNHNAARQLSPDSERYNLAFSLNHELDSGAEVYTDFSYYKAEVDRTRQQAGVLSNGRFQVPADYYWNPLGPVTFADGRANPNRVVPAGDPDVPDEGLGFELRNYAALDSGPRDVNVEDTSFRFVAGMRGDWNDWSYDTGVVYSEAETVDSTDNRVSATLFQQSLMMDTADAYNVFTGVDIMDPTSPHDPTRNSLESITPFRINVKRESDTSLTLVDFKISNPDVFSLPAGNVGMAVGVEWREEDFTENRDSRSDGSITFTDQVTGEFLNFSDIVGSSASPDADGERRVTSLFAEFLVPLLRDIPLVQSLDLQVAVRHEDFSDVGSVTKPKFALSWYLTDWLQLRGAYSEGFRAPNLTQLHIPAITVVNNVNDPVTGYSGGIEERRTGNTGLEPEETENKTFGIVVTPTDNLTLTLDYWEIEQDGVVGLLNADNAVLLDSILREQGSSFDRLERDPVTGEPTVFNDTFQNQELRETSGIDFSVAYFLDTSFGELDAKVNVAYLDKFKQSPGPEQQIIIDNGLSAAGSGDLLGLNDIPEYRATASLNWRRNQWGAGLFFNYVDDTEDTSTSADSDTGAPDDTYLPVDSFLTVNGKVDYRFEEGFADGMRLRVGVNNMFDEDPPLADESFGYNGKLHSNRGRYFYIDLAMNF